MAAKEANVDCPIQIKEPQVVSDRWLVEYCCSPDSVLGGEKYNKAGCMSVRLTIHHDLTTQSGLDHALQQVRSTQRGEYVHLWGALPCTGGSPWQRINARHASARELIEQHLSTFGKLIKNFVKVAEEVVKLNGDASFE